ncbi:MAG: DNA primase [Crocinitomicaceae bacterium]|nr:DNA primase [Crocinitomicaceae bacterium]
MANIPPHIVDDIMQTARIEEVIGEFVSLKKAGSNLKGLSPFTDEKTPSFVVSPGKQIFKCFSTGKGGSVVTFLMEKEHFSYPEALRWLADKYGIQIPEEKPLTSEEQAAISERESLHIINEFAKEHFKKNMTGTEEGKSIGLSYFVERGFRPDIIEKFQLGYCLNSGTDFTDAAREKGYKLEYLEKVGLVKTKDDRNFDFFRGRVMFPIHSVSGRVLGFGGRTLFTDKKIAKYFNSPESIIYNKSEILYGLYYSKGDIIKYDNCFLCEGYTDVISMYQAGIQNVVSSSGTSLTKEQIRLIKRYTNNVTILYDGDAAGIKASFRGIDLILQEGLNVKVVLFPDGEDPDSYSKKVSTSELENYIKEHTQDFISFKADILLKDDGDDPLKRAELIKDIVHSVGLIPDSITRTVFIQKIAAEFQIQEAVLDAELLKIRKNTLAKEFNEPEIRELPVEHQAVETYPEFIPEFTETATGVRLQPEEFALIRLMVLYGPLATEVMALNEHGQMEETEISVIQYICNELEEDELFFDTPVLAKIHQVYAEGLANNELYRSSVLKRQEDQEIVRLVSDIEANEHEISDNWYIKHHIETRKDGDRLKQAVPQAIYAFKLYKLEKRINEIRQALKNDIQDEEELTLLLVEQVTLEKIKLQFTKELGRTILR